MGTSNKHWKLRKRNIILQICTLQKMVTMVNFYGMSILPQFKTFMEEKLKTENILFFAES